MCAAQTIRRKYEPEFPAVPAAAAAFHTVFESFTTPLVTQAFGERLGNKERQ
jgi:hypothetical protein